ncbi:MAG: cytochrome c [Labilithrix sp.]|nr:cytochrome c [Labilithrix sp.]MCW5810760.1 cytochrome c [Labilithrix sp.]
MKWSVLILSLSGLAGCYPKTTAAPPTLTAAQLEVPALARGREVFAAKCNGCHGYPDLGAVGAAKWPAVMDDMGRKASLTPADTDAALQYVLAARGR